MGYNGRKFKDPGETCWRFFYIQYRNRTKVSNVPFELTEEQFQFIAKQNCTYCGKEPRDFNRYLNSKGKKYSARVTDSGIARSWIKINSVDQIVPGKGYTLTNSAPCCIDCQHGKMSNSVETYLAMCERVVNYQRSKNG